MVIVNKPHHTIASTVGGGEHGGTKPYSVCKNSFEKNRQIRVIPNYIGICKLVLQRM